MVLTTLLEAFGIGNPRKYVYDNLIPYCRRVGVRVHDTDEPNWSNSVTQVTQLDQFLAPPPQDYERTLAVRSRGLLFGPTACKQRDTWLIDFPLVAEFGVVLAQQMYYEKGCYERIKNKRRRKYKWDLYFPVSKEEEERQMARRRMRRMRRRPKRRREEEEEDEEEEEEEEEMGAGRATSAGLALTRARFNEQTSQIVLFACRCNATPRGGGPRVSRTLAWR